MQSRHRLEPGAAKNHYTVDLEAAALERIVILRPSGRAAWRILQVMMRGAPQGATSASELVPAKSSAVAETLGTEFKAALTNERKRIAIDADGERCAHGPARW